MFRLPKFSYNWRVIVTFMILRICAGLYSTLFLIVAPPRRVEEKLLPSPYETQCQDYKTAWKLRGGKGPLNQEMCVAECAFNISMKQCNCVVPGILYHHNKRICNDEELDCFHFNLSECYRICQQPCELDQQLSDHSTVDEIASGAADCRLTYTMANCPQRRKRRGESHSFLFGDADQESETRMSKNALRTGRRQAVDYSRAFGNGPRNFDEDNTCELALSSPSTPHQREDI
ncbi:amiloride-sensitive cation channel 5 [Trichonephila clavipes]|nr:amiloride-sensitive cation channel 5 [Trichonephila clavipes]